MFTLAFVFQQRALASALGASAYFGHGLCRCCSISNYSFFVGAENETRTRDPDLGKVVLYQLSYFRNSKWYSGWDLNPHALAGKGF